MPSVPQYVLRYCDRRLPRDFTGSITLHFTDGVFAVFEQHEKRSRRHMEAEDDVTEGWRRPNC